MENFLPYLELINTIGIIILGIAFYAQNKIVTAIKDFMEIFDTKKVREFADMREETAIGKATNLIVNDEKVREIMHEVTSAKIDEISELYKEEMGKEHLELFKSNIHLIENCLKDQKDEQLRYVNEFLPKNKAKILPILFPEDFEDDKP
ncbi:hypothetical protein FVB32_00990 [Flagellimonas hymeniacidonis]|uniref:Uncharacterized protein n=1 Tax=Flagellimonas hymeniacidonis TaxID=2603628 RepID=A0A5C8V6G2_9FLAO|nr:hypothetical protein [Flagellimonas hymeniacidonis]TXN36893.1 hypothetical protein FVB32_00990 [Flagellimonas hymeniacidonis]